jgi:hypothetical protein
LRKHGRQESHTDVTKRVVKWELGELFTESHDKIVFGVVEFKKDVHTTIRHHPIDKGLGKWCRGLELPIAIDEVLQPYVWQKLQIGNIVH